MSHLSKRQFVKLVGASTAAVALGSTPEVTSVLAAPKATAPRQALAMATPDAQMQIVLGQLMALNAPPINTLTPFNARQTSAVMQAVIGTIAAEGKPPVEPVGKVSHQLIQGPGGQLFMRVYTPVGEGPFPVLVYYHGGGWVIANLDTYDSSCRALTNAAGCIVVSVAYRQAPEAKFPAAHQDAFAAYQWVVNNAASIGGDPARIAIGGESAGGNLAASTAIQARDRGVKLPVHQMLIYPIANYAFNTPSYEENAAAMPLNRPLMQWFFAQYLRTAADGANPLVSILRAPNLRGLPAATVITAEIDPLRDEGEAYANRLREAGVAVTSTRYTGVTHEFFSMPGVLDKAKQAVMEAAMGLRGAFGTTLAPDTTGVPNVVGLAESFARQVIEAAGLTVEAVDEQGADQLGDLYNRTPAGAVVSTDPAPNTAVPNGSSVVLGVRA